MMLRRSGKVTYRTRLVLLSTAATVVTLVVAGAVLLAGAHHVVYGDIDSSLRERGEIAVALQNLADDERSQDSSSSSPGQGQPLGPPGSAGSYGRFLEADGSIAEPPKPPRTSAQDKARQARQQARLKLLPAVLRAELRRNSTLVPPVSAAAKALVKTAGSGSLLETVRTQGVPFRVATFARARGGGIQLARPLNEADATFHRMQMLVGATILFGSLIALLVSLVVTRAATEPVRRLTRLATDIAESRDLTRRVARAGGPGDELSVLADRFDDMLDALEHSTQQQQQLIDDAAHELRTPLTSLRMNMDVLVKHQEEHGELSQEILGELSREVDDLVATVRDVMDLASSIQSDATTETLAMEEIVSAAVERSRRAHPDSEIELETNHDWLVRGSAERLVRAIANLLDNAAKWTDAGTQVSVRSVAGSVEVRDHGPGVPDADKAKVFDRFHRGFNGEQTSGSGLGLAIVDSIVRAHGGSVSVHDAPGGGAVFRIALPEAAAY